MAMAIGDTLGRCFDGRNLRVPGYRGPWFGDRPCPLEKVWKIWSAGLECANLVCTLMFSIGEVRLAVKRI